MQQQQQQGVEGGGAGRRHGGGGGHWGAMVCVQERIGGEALALQQWAVLSVASVGMQLVTTGTGDCTLTAQVARPGAEGGQVQLGLGWAERPKSNWSH